jgi:hypothetical protein
VVQWGTKILNFILSLDPQWETKMKVRRLLCHMAYIDWATWHSVYFYLFFNVLSNRGIKRKLSSNNRDQMPTKNVQELISKVCVIAETDYIFKP